MDLSAIRIKVQADTKEAEGSLAKLKKTGESLSSVGKSLTLGLTTPIVALGTASLMAASNAGEMESKFNTVFKNLASEADSWATTYADAIGRSKYEIKEAISNQADLYQGMGFTSDEAFDLSKKVTTLGYDLASFNNVNDADAVNAMTKALMGETESAKMLGVNLTDTVMETSEFTKATGKSWKELSMAEKAQVRYQEAMKQSQNAIGDAEKTSDSFANMLKRLKGQFKDISVEIGKVMLPIAEKLTKVISGVLDRVMKLLQENPKLAQTIVVIAGALAALGPTIFIVGKLITLFAAFPVTMGIVAAVIATAGLAFLTFNGQLEGAYQSLLDFMKGLITNILTLIANVLPELLIKGIEIITNLALGIAEAIPGMMSAFANYLMDMVLILAEKGVDFYFGMYDAILAMLDGLIKAVPALINGLITGIVNMINVIRERLPEFLKKGLEIVGSLVAGIAERAPQMISKVFQLITDTITTIIKRAPEFIVAAAGLIADLAKGLWDNREKIFSIMKDLMKGAIDVIKNTIKGFFNMGKEIVVSLWDGVKSMWSSFTGWIGDKLSSIPIIGKLFTLTPEVDDSGLTAPDAAMFGASPFSRAGGLLGMLETPDLFGGSSRASIQSGASASNPFATLEAAIERLSNSKMAGAVETIINIDGREFARTTTPYISRELAWGTR